MKRLLLATDLSARSDRALERALALAHEHDAELAVIHVIDDDLVASVAHAREEEALKVIQGHIDKLKEDNAPRVSVEVAPGRAYAEILEKAEQTNTDLIILGMHREQALKDMFRGTTVERIVRAGNVPVLLVKDRITGPYRRIIVAVDFSVYSRRAVTFATEFGPEAEFHLVHAYDVPFKGFIRGQGTQREVSKRHQLQLQKMIDEEMARFLAEQETKPPKLQPVMQEGSAYEVIGQQVDRLKPDLLILGTHGRTGAAHSILGSVAETLLTDPPCDILAVKAW